MTIDSAQGVQDRKTPHNRFLRHTSILIWKSFLQRQRRWRYLLMETIFAVVLFSAAIYIAKPIFITSLNAEPVRPIYWKDILAPYPRNTILGYTPYVWPVPTIMRRAARILNSDIISGSNEDDLHNKLFKLVVSKEQFNPKLSVVWVIFKQNNEMSNRWKFTIRSTERARYENIQESKTNINPHLSTGFLAVQLAISHSILVNKYQRDERIRREEYFKRIRHPNARAVTPLATTTTEYPDNVLFYGYPTFELSLVSMPVSLVVQEKSVRKTISVILLFFTLALIPPVLETEALVVNETTKRFKRSLRIRSVDYSAMYLSWIVYAHMTALPICFLASITLILIFRWIHLVFALMLLMAYLSVMIMNALIMAMFHSKAWVSCIWSTLFTLVMTYLAELVVHHHYDEKHQALTFLLQVFIPPLGLVNAFNSFALLQTGQRGRGSTTNSQSLAVTIGSWSMLILIYFGLLMLMQRTVAANALGGPVSWKKIIFKKSEDVNKLRPVKTPTGKEREHLQEVNEFVAKAISLKSVSKSIMGEQVIKNITLDVYRGEYTVFFCERVQERIVNTIEDLLTGLTFSDEGAIYVLGHLLAPGKNCMNTPHVMGYCHWSNLLIDDLTVEEHLIMYTEICLWQESRQYITEYGHVRKRRLLTECNLEIVRRTRVKNVGLYYRAQLCWAIAMLLEPWVIIVPNFVDQPDFVAVIKDKIMNYRKYLTIVHICFTSIELEYADRVFVFDSKMLAFGGTPSYMFYKYGRGYRVRLTLRCGEGDDEEDDKSDKAHKGGKGKKDKTGEKSGKKKKGKAEEKSGKEEIGKNGEKGGKEETGKKDEDDKGEKDGTDGKGEKGEKDEKGKMDKKGEKGEKDEKGETDKQDEKGGTDKQVEKGGTDKQDEKGEKDEKGETDKQDEKGGTDKQVEKGGTDKQDEKGEKDEKGKTDKQGEKEEKDEKGETDKQDEKGEKDEKGETDKKGENSGTGEKAEKGEMGEKEDKEGKEEKATEGEKKEEEEKEEKGDQEEKDEKDEKEEKDDKGEKGEKSEKMISRLITRATEAGATVRAHYGSLIILRLPVTPTKLVAELVQDLTLHAIAYNITSLNITVADSEEIYKRSIYETRTAIAAQKVEIPTNKKILRKLAEPRRWEKKSSLCNTGIHLRDIGWKVFSFHIRHRSFMIVTIIAAVVAGLFLGLAFCTLLSKTENDEAKAKLLRSNVLTLESLHQRTTLVIRTDATGPARSIAEAYVLSEPEVNENNISHITYTAFSQSKESESLTEYLATRAVESPYEYITLHAYGLDTKVSGSKVYVKALYSTVNNDTGAAARSMAKTYTSLLRHYAGQPSASIQVTDDPLYYDLTPRVRYASRPPFLVQFLLIVSVAHVIFIPSKEHGLIKHTQTHARNFSPASYWFTLYFCDFVLYWLQMIMVTGAMFTYMYLNAPHGYFYYEDLLIVPVLLAMYGIVSIPQAYLFSLSPRATLNAVTYIIVNLILGETTVLATYLYGDSYSFALTFMRMSPQFNLVYAMVKIKMIFLYNVECISFLAQNKCSENLVNRCCPNCGILTRCFERKNYFGSQGIIPEIISMSITTLIYLSLLLMIEYKIFCRIWSKLTKSMLTPENISAETPLSAGCTKEKKNVIDKMKEITAFFRPKEVNAFGECLLAHNVSKKEAGFYTCSDVYLGLSKGNTLALSGLKRHGRLDLCNIMAGYETPSDGSVWSMSKYRSDTQPHMFSSNISYSNGSDCLPPWMTVKDSLYLIALLRGVPRKYALDEVNNHIEVLELKEKAKQMVSTITSKERTRLNFAAAVIGAPPIIALDEFSAYQSFSVKRVMYYILYHLRQRERALFLSASEVESHMPLVDKLAILVDGAIYDVDTVDNLVKRYSTTGYTVVAHLMEGVDVNNVNSMFGRYFNNFAINDATKVLVNVQIFEDLSWSTVFEKMENLKTENNKVLSYAITAISIDYIYNSILRAERGNRVATNFLSAFWSKSLKKKMVVGRETMDKLVPFEHKYDITKLKELPWTAIFQR